MIKFYLESPIGIFDFIDNVSLGFNKIFSLTDYYLKFDNPRISIYDSDNNELLISFQLEPTHIKFSIHYDEIKTSYGKSYNYMESELTYIIENVINGFKY